MAVKNFFYVFIMLYDDRMISYFFARNNFLQVGSKRIFPDNANYKRSIG